MTQQQQSSLDLARQQVVIYEKELADAMKSYEGLKGEIQEKASGEPASATAVSLAYAAQVSTLKDRVAEMMAKLIDAQRKYIQLLESGCSAVVVGGR